MHLIHCLSHPGLQWRSELPAMFKGYLVPGSQAFTATGNFGCIAVQQYETPLFRIRVYMLQAQQVFIFKSLTTCTQYQSLVSLSGKWKLHPDSSKHLLLEKHQFVLPGRHPELVSITMQQKLGILFELCFSGQLLVEMNDSFPTATNTLGHSKRTVLSTTNINSEITSLISSITHCRYTPSIRSVFVNSRVRDILFQFLLIMEGENNRVTRSISEHDKELVAEAERIINADISKSHTLESIATQLSISPASFKRLFTAVKGMRPLEYVVAQRMQYAKELLLAGASVKKVAATTGYQKAGFIRAFLKFYGTRPGSI